MLTSAPAAATTSIFHTASSENAGTAPTEKRSGLMPSACATPNAEAEETTHGRRAEPPDAHDLHRKDAGRHRRAEHRRENRAHAAHRQNMPVPFAEAEQPPEKRRHAAAEL